MIDLDNFRTLNDTLGHDAGDLLLQLVGQRLSHCIREGDTVARVGGDEFAVMLEDLSEQAQEALSQTETMGTAILAALNRSYLVAGQACQSTPSIGATLFNAHDSTVEELLKQTDLAMYRAKARGRNTFRFFAAEMTTRAEHFVALEKDLRLALSRRQFDFDYQPVVRLDDGKPLANARLRFVSPTSSFIVTTDANGVQREVRYDIFGRVKEVFSAYQFGTATPTTTYSYALGGAGVRAGSERSAAWVGRGRAVSAVHGKWAADHRLRCAARCRR